MQLLSMLCKTILLALSLTLCIRSEIEPLDLINRQIPEACWVIDTTNLTEIAMGNCVSQLYFITLGVGTPPQKVNFQIDTIRELIWLSLDSGFDVNQSETLEVSDNTTKTVYHEQVIEAQLGSQIVMIQSTNISTRNNIAYTPSIKFAFGSIIGGLFGLGFSQKPNFFDNAYLSNQIQSPIFSLQMSSDHEESYIYYNTLPDWLLDETLFVPIAGSSAWKVNIESLKIGDTDYSYIVSKFLILDSSITLLYLNPSLYQHLIDKFLSECNTKNSRLYCNCSIDFPQIVIELENVLLEIEPEHYVRLNHEKKCEILIGKTQHENSPIMGGSVLMKNYIITFDKYNQRIGFNGESIGIWKQIFYICQYTVIGMLGLLLGFGLYLLWDNRVRKSEKQAKKKACKNKGKKYQKPEISLTFLEN